MDNQHAVKIKSYRTKWQILIIKKTYRHNVKQQEKNNSLTNKDIEKLNIMSYVSYADFYNC